MNNKALKIYIITILLIIFFLIISFINYGKIEISIPTGNVDIFDININCECTDCPKCSCKKNETPIEIPKEESIEASKNEESEVKEPTEPEEEIIYKDGLIEGLDKTELFQNQAELKIFENPTFYMTNKIAPGDSNSYQFVVRNNNDFSINYKISLDETNPYKMNMKYRLKVEGYYIDNDEWKTYKDINTTLRNLSALDSESYTLEWKWSHGTNDATAGKNDATYKLKIIIDAEYKEI